MKRSAILPALLVLAGCAQADPFLAKVEFYDFDGSVTELVWVEAGVSDATGVPAKTGRVGPVTFEAKEANVVFNQVSLLRKDACTFKIEKTGDHVDIIDNFEKCGSKVIVEAQGNTANAEANRKVEHVLKPAGWQPENGYLWPTKFEEASQ